MFPKTSINQLKITIEKQFATSTDFMTKTFRNEETKITLIYLASMCDEQKIKKDILKPFSEAKSTVDFEHHLSNLPNLTALQSMQETIDSILRGNVAVFLPHRLLLVDTKQATNDQPTESTIENTIQGPQKALSESAEISLQQIRSRYIVSSLKVEEQTVGAKSQTLLYLTYDEALVDPEVLNNLKERLSQIDVDILQAAGQLENFLNCKRRTLFPTMMITERPDRIVMNLAQGKVVVLIDGTPFALIVPAVFYDFFSAVDDLYQTYFVGHFLLVLRYIGLFVSLTVPALYISITSFNPEIFRVQLTVSLAGSRAAVPYPSFLEVIFMLGMMELLTEASLRLPKAIGSTATTVGGLILGQAAQQAGLVSSIMIIVVAAVAISNFVIPINTMSFSIRVTKYILVFFSILFGVIGVMGSLVALIIHLCSLRSFGQPYFKLFMNEKHHIAKSNLKGN